jgi:hypothetical protein
MKKILFTLLAGVLISISTMAQSKSEARAEKITNRTIERIETTTKLSAIEKDKYIELQKTRLINRSEIDQDLRKSDPDKFKEKAKANNKLFRKNLIDAFGKKRASEILAASKKK